MRLAKRGELLTHHKDKSVLRLLKINSVIENDFIPVTPDIPPDSPPAIPISAKFLTDRSISKPILFNVNAKQKPAIDPTHRRYTACDSDICVPTFVW